MCNSDTSADEGILFRVDASDAAPSSLILNRWSRGAVRRGQHSVELSPAACRSPWRLAGSLGCRAGFLSM